MGQGSLPGPKPVTYRGFPPPGLGDGTGSSRGAHAPRAAERGVDTPLSRRTQAPQQGRERPGKPEKQSGAGLSASARLGDERVVCQGVIGAPCEERNSLLLKIVRKSSREFQPFAS